MRTTLTLDDDVAMALKHRAFESGRPFKEVVNEVLRRGLTPRPSGPLPEPPVHDCGELTMTLSEARDIGMDPETLRFLRVTEMTRAEQSG